MGACAYRRTVWERGYGRTRDCVQINTLLLKWEPYTSRLRLGFKFEKAGGKTTCHRFCDGDWKWEKWAKNKSVKNNSLFMRESARVAWICLPDTHDMMQFGGNRRSAGFLGFFGWQGTHQGAVQTHRASKTWRLCWKYRWVNLHVNPCKARQKVH